MVFGSITATVYVMPVLKDITHGDADGRCQVSISLSIKLIYASFYDNHFEVHSLCIVDGVLRVRCHLVLINACDITQSKLITLYVM